jgi:hypothetical protein
MLLVPMGIEFLGAGYDIVFGNPLDVEVNKYKILQK